MNEIEKWYDEVYVNGHGLIGIVLSLILQNGILIITLKGIS